MASNRSNTSNVAKYDQYYEFTVDGSLTVTLNIFLLIILFSDKCLLKKSAFIFGLAIGDVLDGFSLLTSGLVRIKRANENTIDDLVHPSVCLTQITSLFVLSNQITGTMFLIIGIERFIAVKYFGWYHKNWTDRVSWICTTISFVYSLISLGVVFVITFTQPNNATVSYVCSTPLVIGMAYSFYNYMVPVVGGSIAILATIASLIVFRRRRRQLYSNISTLSFSNNNNSLKQSLRKQWKLTKVFLILAILDFALMTVPNFVSLLAATAKITAFQSAAAYFLQIICGRGAISLFVYIFINSDFRAVTCQLLHIKTKNTIKPFVTNYNSHANVVSEFR